MVKVIAHLIPENGYFPGNPKLPLLYYKKAFDLESKNGAETIKKIFVKNFWYKPWVDGIFDYHHYHSNNHEVLGIARGTATVQFGGEGGVLLDVSRGDALFIPAGVAHKNIESSNDFTVVGAYAIDLDYDMQLGKKTPPKEKINALPIPTIDPIFGEKGQLSNFWK